MPRRALILALMAAIVSAMPAVAQEGEPEVFRSVVPVVGRTLGIANVEWHSALAMTNPHHIEVTVGLTLMGGGEPFFLTTLAPGQTMALGDLVGEVFGSPGRISILEIASIGGPVSVGVRVLGYQNGKLVAQQPIPVYGTTMPFASQRLHGLTVGETFRTNLGIANGGDEDATVTLGLQRIDGRTIASVVVPIAGRSLRQEPLQSYFPLLTEGSNLTVVAEASRANVIVYASVISNSSQQARFIAPAPNFQ